MNDTRPSRRVSVLGCTGSVGRNTLQIVAANPREFEVEALIAGSNADLLAEQARAVRARIAVVWDEARGKALKQVLAGSGIEAASGASAVMEAAARPVDIAMASIVGTAGLAPTLAAMRAGADIALANKECLVAAGAAFMREARSLGRQVLPVDSEHSAIFQVLGCDPVKELERIILTASGGPFRTWTQAQMAEATPEVALKHPNWAMGAKISIDSATMMNKGLELIEAHHLFALAPDRIDILVHPQSAVHGIAEFSDGSMLAQMGAADMRTPIAVALAWPQRMAADVTRLDLAKLGTLQFEAPDPVRFPALRLAREALAAGGVFTAVLNAANEVAVDAFLKRRIGFLTIAELVERALGWATPRFNNVAADLTTIIEVDGAVRRQVEHEMTRIAASRN